MADLSSSKVWGDLTVSRNITTMGAVTGTSFNSITGLEGTATNIKMDGTQSAGTLTTVARADHVHPTDTSKAATNQTMYIGTTSVAINRTSASLALTGITSIDGSAVSATTATNLANGSSGTIPYQSGSGTTSMLAAGTAGQVLQSNGASAPSWHTLSSSDVGLVNVENTKLSTWAGTSNITTVGAVTGTSFNSITGLSSTTPNMDGAVAIGVSTTTARADHIHPTDTSRAASSHTHGNITNAGAIGSTSGLPIITTASGVLTTGSFGTTAGTFCQGNDSRLSGTGNTTNSLVIKSDSGSTEGTDLYTFNGSAAKTINFVSGTNITIAETSGTLTFNGPAFEATATNIKMDGTQSVGSLSTVARADHVHPSDTSKAATNQTMYIGTTSIAINRSSGALALTGITSIDGSAASATTATNVSGGTVSATTGTFSGAVTGTSFNSITGLSSAAPAVDGTTAAVGVATTAARADHVHPTGGPLIIQNLTADPTTPAVGQIWLRTDLTV